MADIKIIFSPDGLVTSMEAAKEIEKYTRQAKENLANTTMGSEDGAAQAKEMVANLKKRKAATDEVTKSIKDENTATSKLTIDQKTYSELTKSIEKEEAKLKVAMSDRVKKLDELRAATARQNQLNKEELKINQSQAGSMDRLRAELARYTRQRNELGDALGKNKGKFDELTKKMNENNAAQDKLSDKALLQKRNIGNYQSALEGLGDKLTSLPGPFGTAASAMAGFGSKVTALGPLGALVGGVSLAIGGLFAAFKDSATGTAMLKEAAAQWKVVFEDVRADAIRTTTKIAEFMRNQSSKEMDWGDDPLAAKKKTAEELTKAQKELNKEIAFHISESEKENRIIQEGMFLARDKTKSEAETLAILQNVLTVSKEKADREKRFAQEQFRIDLGLAMNKADVAEQDKKMFEDWIKMDTDQQMAALKGSKVLQDYYNVLGGSAAVKELEESYAKIGAAETEYFARNKRAASQLSTAQMEIAKEKEDAFNKEIELRKLQAGEDANLLKAALKYEYDEKIKNAELTQADLKILRLKYLNDIKAIDKQEIENYKKIQDDLKKVKEEDIKATADGDKRWEDEEMARIVADTKKKQEIKKEGLAELDKNSKDITDKIVSDSKDQSKANKKTEEDKKKKDEEVKATKIAALNAVSDVSNSLLDLQAAKNDAAMQKELAAAEGNEAKQEEIKKKYAKKQQDLDVKKAIIATSLAIVRTFVEYGGFTPQAIIAAAAMAVTAGVQIAAIKAQKFAKGGQIEGKLHSEGGTIIEAEKGEYVINRKSTGKYKGLIEGINQDDQMKIMASLHMDRAVNSGREQDKYTKLLYEHLSQQEIGYETPEFYVIRKGTKTTKLRKHA
jgi:hypothetical protein